MSHTPATDAPIPGFSLNPLVKPLCKPFALVAGNPRSLLFIHGFTGSPADFKDFAARYHAAGFDVFVPLMPGHGSHVSQLEGLGYKELLIPFPAVYDYLREHYGEVHLSALSFGCIPVTDLALSHPPRTLCFLAPAFFLTPEQERKIGWARRLRMQKFRGRMPKTKVRAGFKDNGDPNSYNAVAIRAALELHERAAALRARISELHMPVFHAHGGRDLTTPAEANHVFLEQNIANYHYLVLPDAGHVLPMEKCNQFLMQQHIAWMETV
jgi:carboxylesterase